jgi:RNA polymerase sigma-70 factor (ECF subfamily)
MGPDSATRLPAGESGLVRRAQAGDRAAFGELYRHYVPMVHGLLLARTGPGRADDLVHEVFLRALGHLHELRDPEALPGWLARIARNLAKDAARGTPPPAELPVELEDRPSPGAEAREALSAVLALPEAYREPLLLRLVEGMSGPEIAARTGLTPGSVRVNLCRGFKLLRERLRGRGGP